LLLGAAAVTAAVVALALRRLTAFAIRRATEEAPVLAFAATLRAAAGFTLVPLAADLRMGLRTAAG
jgi:hypothetical protein